MLLRISLFHSHSIENSIFEHEFANALRSLNIFFHIIFFNLCSAINLPSIWTAAENHVCRTCDISTVQTYFSLSSFGIFFPISAHFIQFIILEISETYLCTGVFHFWNPFTAMRYDEQKKTPINQVPNESISIVFLLKMWRKETGSLFNFSWMSWSTNSHAEAISMDVWEFIRTIKVKDLLKYVQWTFTATFPVHLKETHIEMLTYWLFFLANNKNNIHPNQ